ncbi:putative ribonuclease H [Helianthus annuus]|nr:putative ribonuclease H [Helianthus annuus]
MFNDPETRYSMMEKLVLALVHTYRRLRRYFAGHVINVLTNYKIGQILSKPEISGILAKRSMELGGHNLVYKPRPTIRRQVLADFATEVLANRIQECEEEQNPTPLAPSFEIWTLYTDGVSNKDGAGVGLRLVSPDNQEFTYAIRPEFKSTNNEAEYEAFLAGLRLVIKLVVQNLEVHVDSLLVVGQINGEYTAKGNVIVSYLEKAKKLISKFQSFKVIHINRSANKQADALSKLASIKHLAKGVHIEVLKNHSMPLHQVNLIEMGSPSWMTPIIRYLESGMLPKKKRRRTSYNTRHAITKWETVSYIEDHTWDHS